MKIIFDEKPALIITVNGPGELFYWVRPLLNTLFTNKVPIQVWVFLTPCQFSTGREQEALQKNQLVTRIFSPPETKLICWGRSSLVFPQKGLVLFLGGDILNAVLLKKRSGYPLWVYGSYLRWLKHVDLYLARYRCDYERYQFTHKKFIGDLLYSYVKQWNSLLNKNNSNHFFSGSPRILFLPGSRSLAYQFVLNFYQQIAALIQELYSNASFAIGFPGYYSEGDIPSLGEPPLSIPLYFGVTSHLISHADITLTIPGSNNMELFYRKRKALILLPLESTYQDIPLTGIPELIGKIPGIGPIIKRKIIQSLNHREKWVSLPNILMNREIYPELRGKVHCNDVVLKVNELIHGSPWDIEVPENDFPSSADLVLSQMIEESILC